MNELAGIALPTLAVTAGLAVLSALLALADGSARHGRGGRFGRRLERLARPVWERRFPPGGRRTGGEDHAAAAGLNGPDFPKPAWGSRFVALVRATAAGVVAGWVLSGQATVAAMSGVAAIWIAMARWRARNVGRRRRFAAGLEEALEAMVASLRSGQGLTQAVEEAATRSAEPVATALKGVVRAVQTGRPLPVALADLARDWSLPEVSYLSACLDTHLQTGGDVTVLLLNLGGMLRERRHLSRELGARTGEARATATLLALLPPGLLLYMVWFDASQLEPLLVVPFGRAAVIYAAASWLAGVLIIRKMLSALGREVEGEG